MAPTVLSSSFSSPISIGLVVPTIRSPNTGRSITTLKNPMFSSSPISFGLVPTSRSPKSARITAVHGLKNPSPCLMLPPTFEGGDDMVYNMYNLAQNKVLKFNNKKLMPEEDTQFVGSSHGWLSLFNERNCDLILTNPVTRRHVRLPPPINIDVSDGVKVILSCDAEKEECQAMMIDDSQRLAFCCPGRSPTEWTPLGALKKSYEVARCYEDLVYLRGPHNLFICVTESGNGDDFEAWDVASDPPRLRWENRDDLLTGDKYFSWSMQAERLLLDKMKMVTESHTYLVFAEQTDQLFFVTRHIVRSMHLDGSCVDIKDIIGTFNKYPYKTVSFDVYKLDWELDGEGGSLSQLDDVGLLDGLALFVGLNHAFAVLATEANRLKPNSIYFTDDIEVTPFRKINSKYGGHDIGIFDYESKTISPCYYPCDVQSFTRIRPEPFWFIPSEN